MSEGELNTEKDLISEETVKNVVDTVNIIAKTSKIDQLIGNRSLLEISFGGSKRFIIIAMTLAILASYFAGVEIPDRVIDMCLGIIGVYFGAGAIAIGGKIASK